jgi:hypothetical protein
MSSAVAHALPASILALFAPRSPIEYKPPIKKRKMPNYTTIASFVSHFEDPKDTPPAKAIEVLADRKQRVRAAKAEAAQAKVDAAAEAYDPSNDPKIGTGDPYKTLFVARVGYETTDETLRTAFEQFGPIKSCKLVLDTVTGKSRGYGFIEFEHERDMKTAYKQGDGKKIDGRRVLVDVERGRTVNKWRPRRLGGGLGSTRASAKGTAAKISSQDADHSSASGGGGYAGSAPAPRASGTSTGSAPSFSWSTETRADRDRGDRGYRSDRRDGDRGGLGYGGGSGGGGGGGGGGEGGGGGDGGGG